MYTNVCQNYSPNDGKLLTRSQSERLRMT